MRTRAINVLLVVAVVLLMCFTFGSIRVGARESQSSKTPREELSSQDRIEAEQRLWDLGYWAGPVDGKLDSVSRHALIAFQKVERRARTGNLTLNELNALRNASRPTARHGHYGHVEIDLERQVLFVIDETGAVLRVLPVSTGNGKLYVDRGRVQRAHTPTGSFKVLRKIKGWRLSSLGLLYYPSYIHNGIAVHGSPSVPNRPASHGCIRVPMFAAKELSSLLPVGMQVEIYDGKS
jgi:peptidoglycan hydrolase-like protein with peptidoglycan-binding domain